MIYDFDLTAHGKRFGGGWLSGRRCKPGEIVAMDGWAWVFDGFFFRNLWRRPERPHYDDVQ